MAELTIKTIIDAGKKSLEDKNYWSALVVALTIPSMCSRIEYANEKYKGNDRNDANGIWYEDDKRQYFDGNNRDDRLLYNRLCDESRADYLLEQHKKEIDRRNG